MGEPCEGCIRLQDACEELEKKVQQLKAWVEDCQAGMYINCVYCGHRYGPDDEMPAAMADVLKEHIEQCPEHPMSTLKAENERLQKSLKEASEHQGKMLALVSDYRECGETLEETIARLLKEFQELSAKR
jgi:hypothetical protein